MRFGPPERLSMKKLLPVLLLAGCATNAPATAPQVDKTGWTYEPYELTAQQRTVIEKTISAELKDPDSARYSRFKARKVVRPGNQVAIELCVFVNAKNSYGGYSGATPYMGEFPHETPTQFKIMGLRGSEHAQFMSQVCARNGLLAST
jgi:hypothetical protein